MGKHLNRLNTHYSQDELSRKELYSCSEEVAGNLRENVLRREMNQRLSIP